MIDGGGSNNGGGPMAKFGSTVPLLLAQAIETLRAVGFDLPAVLNANTPETGGNGNRPPSDPLDQIAAEVDATSAPPRRSARRAPPPLDPPAERPEAPGL